MNIVEVILAFFVGLMFLVLFCFIFSVSFSVFKKLLVNVVIGAVAYALLSAFSLTSLNILGALLVGSSGGIGVILACILL